MADRDRTVAMELDVLLTAQARMPKGYAFREGGNPLTRVAGVLRPGREVLDIPCLAYAVHHPAGTILIDTGMHPDASGNLRRDFGAAMGLLFRSLRPAHEPFDQQLRAVGVEPGEVERVIMTHLHVDHTSGMRLLPRAEFTCAREEWAATRGRFAAGKGYVPHHLPSESRMRLVDFEADGEPHGAFSSTVDLLGDGSIRLISTPGHTAGHLSVLLRLDEGRQVLVVGDAAYTLRSLEEEILPLVTTDDGASRRSLRELRAFSEQEPEAVLVPSHDPTAWQELHRTGASA
ncbi:MAG TPA: N-acyl homoserine lactonase family protein [Thermoleophilaceae bacterium]|nr:N-acyl homoserine lactonase family protein [Thermoleophilaceae bacterium]